MDWKRLWITLGFAVMLLPESALADWPVSSPDRFRVRQTFGWAVADSGKRPGLSFDALGFAESETRSDPQLQSELNTRSDMLRIHQTLGLVTAVPMTTTYILGLTSGDDTDLHAALGITTAVLYTATASLAIFAPKPEGLKDAGSSEIHKILAFVHFPLMILTPILGSMIDDNPNGNIKTLHLISATALLGTYLTSMAVMTFNL